MDETNIIERKKNSLLIENNMLEKLKYIASEHNEMNAFELNGVSVVNSNLSSDTFNTAFGGNIDEKIAREVFAYYNNIKTPMAWWIGPNSNTEKARKSLSKAGFVHDELDIGMIGDFSQLNDYKYPSNLLIRKCQTKNDFCDFGNVLASVFDPEDEQVKIFYKKMADLPLETLNKMILFVGYENNYPVSSACLFLTDVAGIYDVATRPEKRKLGFGSAMFYRALCEAKERKYKIGVLQASPDGLNIYKRFGFEEVCQFNVWSNKERLYYENN